MKIGVLGTGQVGRTLSTKLVSLGHDVTLGSRTADNPTAAKWAEEEHSPRAAHGTFADAAAGADLVVNATAGTVSVAALTAAGAVNLRGKVLVDVSNALDFSGGGPAVAVPEGSSVAEQIQSAFPETRVVKTLNTMGNALMVDPSRVPGHHNVFLCGDDPAARAEVASLLREFGWTDVQILDLGDLTGARGLESLVILWMRLYGKLQTPDFNVAVVMA